MNEMLQQGERLMLLLRRTPKITRISSPDLTTPIPSRWSDNTAAQFSPKTFSRPYTPIADYSPLLLKSKCSGLGTIHWTTRPIDLYFKNLSAQAWQGTKDEALAAICREMAASLQHLRCVCLPPPIRLLRPFSISKA
jgi:hypothetical protein